MLRVLYRNRVDTNSIAFFFVVSFNSYFKLKRAQKARFQNQTNAYDGDDGLRFHSTNCDYCNGNIEIKILIKKSRNFMKAIKEEK